MSKQGPSTELVITRRGMRVVQALTATAVGLLLVGLTGIGSATSSADRAWLGLDGEQALAAAPCPSPTSVALPSVSPGRLAAAREGRFDVFGPRRTELRVPIDWTTDPLGARRYRQNLHKLRFLDPLLAGYAASGDEEDLRRALAIGIDWVRSNRRDDPDTPDEAWSDKVVGDRVPHLAYLLRASACEGLPSGRERRDLLDSLEEHGRYLASNANYVADNHGLFVDLGLLRLTRFFPFFGESERWAALARERFEATLRGRLAEGVWLEHSSAYQLLAIRSVEDWLRVFGPDPEISELLDRMRAAAGWFVKPDGELTQFGDSNLESVPDWGSAAASGSPGLQAYFRAGFAFVRAQGVAGDLGYLAVTDGFHNLTHKHADELSFELFDHGTSVVSDTGLYDKDPGPIRDFVISNRAHSGLTVDGLDLPISDPSAAYGSGLTAAGQGDGWYAIEGKNPMLRAQGVRHRRLFAYRPGEALVVVDRVESPSPHTYTRYLQLDPGLDIDPTADGAVGLSGAGFAGRVYDLPAEAQAVRSQARGQAVPRQGFTSPDFRDLVPRWTLAYSDQAATETRALSIALDANRIHARRVRASGGEVTVGLVDGAGARTRLEVARAGRRLALSEVAEPAP